MKTLTDEELLRIAKESTSKRDFAAKCGFSASYKKPYDRLVLLGADLSHWYMSKIKDYRQVGKRKYTDEQLVAAVAASKSKNDCRIKLGLRPSSGWYHTIRKALERLKLDTSHWTSRKNSGNPNGGAVLRTEDLLVDGRYVGSSALKKRLWRMGLLKRSCYVCNMGEEWQGRFISLQLDHINGRNDDNRIENLRILCPNCHSQTATYAGKNKTTDSIWGGRAPCPP